MRILRRSVTSFCVFVLLQSFVFLHHASAQNYTLKVTNEQYQPLTNSTPLMMPWTEEENPYTYVSPAPNASISIFNTKFDLTAPDAFAISKWGNLQILNDDYVVIIDGWHSANLDSLIPSAGVSLQVDGPEGDRIFKVQYKDMGNEVLTEAEYVNCQIWLYEKAGLFQFRYGPVVQPTCDMSAAEPQGPFVGLFKATPDFSQIKSIYWLTGDPATPKITKSNIVALKCFPAEGTVYTIGVANASVSLPTASNTVLKQVVQERIYLDQHPERATLYDIRGVKVREWSTPTAVLEVGNLPNGVYHLQVENDHHTANYQILKVKS